MAIIGCPHCGKPTSSKAMACQSCGQLLGAENGANTARNAARARRERVRRATSQAVLATLLGVSGGLWLLLGDAPRHSDTARIIALVMLLGGLAWYLYLRIRLWLYRHR